MFFAHFLRYIRKIAVFSGGKKKKPLRRFLTKLLGVLSWLFGEMVAFQILSHCQPRPSRIQRLFRDVLLSQTRFSELVFQKTAVTDQTGSRSCHRQKRNKKPRKRAALCRILTWQHRGSGYLIFINCRRNRCFCSISLMRLKHILFSLSETVEEPKKSAQTNRERKKKWLPVQDSNLD